MLTDRKPYGKYMTELLAIALCTMTASCTEEEMPADTVQTPEECNISILCPGSIDITPLTRAKASEDEANVAKLDFLFFATASETVDQNESNSPAESKMAADDYEYVTCLSTRKITITKTGQALTGYTYSAKTKIMLPRDTGIPGKPNWGILVLANSPYSTDEYNNLGEEAGKQKSGNEVKYFISNLKQTRNPETGMMMPTKDFAMSGWCNAGKISKVDQVLPQVALYRNVARIDVKCGQPYYTKLGIYDAHPYNVRTSGMIVGGLSEEATCSEPNFDFSSETGAYTGFRSPMSGWNGYWYNTMNITEQIYVFESGEQNASVYDRDKVPCLLLKAKYGSNASNTAECWYRIDLNTGTEEEPEYRINRNTLLTVEITGATGIGWATPEEAFTGRTQNLIYTIEEWKESKTDFDIGQTTSLAISEHEKELPAISDGEEFDVNVMTSGIEEGGWTVTSKEQYSWIELSEPEYTPDGGSFSLRVRQNFTSTTADSREAIFNVKAGDITLTYTVSQKKVLGDLKFTATPAQVTARNTGFPEISSSATEDQTVTIAIDGLESYENATWAAHVEGSGSSWCRVRNTAGQDVSTPQKFINKPEIKLGVEIDPLPSADVNMRTGSIHIEVNEDNGNHAEFYLSVKQLFYKEYGDLSMNNRKYGQLTSSGRDYLQLTTNVPYMIDFGALKDRYNFSIQNGKEKGEAGSASLYLDFSKSEIALISGYIDVKSQLTEEILDRIMIILPPSGASYLSHNPSFGYGNSKCGVYVSLYGGGNMVMTYNYNYSTKSDAQDNWFLFGQKENAKEGFNIDPKAWNAGTEEDPVKGDNDPCPDGWRTITATEYMRLANLGAFMIDKIYEDTGLTCLMPSNIPASFSDRNTTSYNTVLYEWTSTVKNGKVIRVKWLDHTTTPEKKTFPNIELEEKSKEELEAEYKALKSESKHLNSYYAVRCIREHSKI